MNIFLSSTHITHAHLYRGLISIAALLLLRRAAALWPRLLVGFAVCALRLLLFQPRLGARVELPEEDVGRVRRHNLILGRLAAVVRRNVQRRRLAAVCRFCEDVGVESRCRTVPRQVAKEFADW